MFSFLVHLKQKYHFRATFIYKVKKKQYESARHNWSFFPPIWRAPSLKIGTSIVLSAVFAWLSMTVRVNLFGSKFVSFRVTVLWMFTCFEYVLYIQCLNMKLALIKNNEHPGCVIVLVIWLWVFIDQSYDCLMNQSELSSWTIRVQLPRFQCCFSHWFLNYFVDFLNSFESLDTLFVTQETLID